MNQTTHSIDPAERGLASLTHLSGLAGYIIPFGGAIVPIIIWIVKKDSPVISTIAKQALLLNLVMFLLGSVLVVLFFTIILIPLVILCSIALSIAAIALPIIGAVKASDGRYYKSPVVGLQPW